MGSNPALYILFFGHKKTRMAGISKGQNAHHIYLTIFYYFKLVTESSDPQKGGAKIPLCKFCDNTFSGCCTSRAAAHILGRFILGQAKARIQAYITINKKDDDRRAVLKNAQRALCGFLHGKDSEGRCCAGKKRKQAVIHELLTPCSGPAPKHQLNHLLKNQDGRI